VIALISLLLLKGNLIIFSDKTGQSIKVAFNGVFSNNAGQGVVLIEKLIPLSGLIILIPIISVATLLIFKYRKIQLRLSLFLIVLSTFLLIAFLHISLRLISKFDASIVPGFKMILPLIILILSILTYRGIKKDDNLVKSYDRLR